MIVSNYVLITIFILNFIFLINFSKIKFFHLNIDRPDKKRKFHSKPTPLAGGTIIFFNLIFYWLIYQFYGKSLDDEIFFKDNYSFNLFIFVCLVVFLLGFIDDRINLKANFKFVVISLIVVVLLLLDENLIINEIEFSFYKRIFNLNHYSIFFSAFCFLVFINAFNMFDGINLQSALYSLLIFFCIIFYYSDSLLIRILIISLVFFSYLNYKNKTFLGDSGTLLISFIIGYVFIKLYNLDYINYADEITLYMMIPGLELIRLFISRIANKKNPLTSDRNHLHHILIDKYSLKKTLLIIFSLILLPLVLNYFQFYSLVTILTTIFVYFILLIYFSKKIKNFL